MAQQWLRAASLVVADDTGNSVELAGPDLQDTLRIRFTVQYQISATPASLKARIYNLSPTTVQKTVGLASQHQTWRRRRLGAVGKRQCARVVYQGRPRREYVGSA
jgi:hypothetical protein